MSGGVQGLADGERLSGSAYLVYQGKVKRQLDHRL